MTSKAAEKRKLILDKAEKVFIRKGFNRVTMKDIIDESNISRGGIYLYFSTVDDIFVEVVKKHNHTKIEGIRKNIEDSDDFNTLIDDFFLDQKNRLLNMDKSLFVAMIEYCFSHKNQPDRDFYTEQFFNTKNMISELLKFGQRTNAISAKNVGSLADSVMFLIEGLRSLAVSSGISEDLADKQLKVCKSMIYSNLF